MSFNNYQFEIIGEKLVSLVFLHYYHEPAVWF